MSSARATTCHYCPLWMWAVGLSLGLFVLLTTGCSSDAGAAARQSAPPDNETLAGTVRRSDRSAPVSGRTVEVVNVATGERRTTETGATGGFTIDLPAGTYRVELALRDGETVVKRPDVISLNHGRADSHIEFVVAPAALVRPRGPAYHLDNGLGSPIA